MEESLEMANRFWSGGNEGMMARFSGLLCGTALLVVVGVSLNGCGSVTPATSTPYGKDEHYYTSRKDSVFGSGGLFGLFGVKGAGSNTAGATNGVGVNAFLWHASLDTLSFMPLSNADPFGGVIITDWYAPPSTPDERFKVTIYILDRDLNAAALKAAVFRQTRDPSLGWVDAPVDAATAQKLEDEILTRARELRYASIEASQQQ